MPPTSAKAAKADSEDPDAWRKDKYGKLLTANALYLREQGKSKMHELYNACLSCKGDWFGSGSRDALVNHLGSADLADDLIARHKEAEKKPGGPDLEPAPTQETSILELAERPPIPSLAITPEQVVQRQLPPSTGPWAVEQSLGAYRRHLLNFDSSIVQILDRDTIISASSAVEGLNRGTFKCTDDFCVVFSASSRGFYLLYRQGLREQALEIASLPPVEEDIARAIVAAADANDAEQADELLRQAVGQRTPLPEATEKEVKGAERKVCYDAVIAAFDRTGNSAKSEDGPG
ncbi:unnamed protein product, partial [Symbiodinium sp. KB8]